MPNWPQIESNIKQVAKANAPLMFLELIAKSALGETSPDLVGYAVATLNNIAVEDSARVAILENAGIEIMTQQLTGTGMGGHKGMAADHPWLREQGISLMQTLGVTHPDPSAPNAKNVLSAPIAKENNKGPAATNKPSERAGTATSRSRPSAGR